MSGRARRLVAALALGDALFVGIYLAHVATGESSWLLGRMFDLDAEATIPAWYASMKLFLVGVVLLVAASPAPGPDRRRPAAPTWFLAGLGVAFVYLSADEAARIHETITLVLRAHPVFPRFSGGHGIWIPLYLAGGAVAVALTARPWLQLRREAPAAFRWLVGGAVLFLCGAVGLEVVGYEGLRAPGRRLLYTLGVAAEEGLELAGATAMLVGALHAEASRRGPPPALPGRAGRPVPGDPTGRR